MCRNQFCKFMLFCVTIHTSILSSLFLDKRFTTSSRLSQAPQLFHAFDVTKKLRLRGGIDEEKPAAARKLRCALFAWESLHSVAEGGVAPHVTELAAGLERS